MNETQIEALKQSLAGIRRRMDSSHKEWVQSVGEAFADWYISAMKEVVKDQYQLVGTLGQAGMVELKERFIAFVQATPPLAKERLSDPKFWSHTQELSQVSGVLAKEDAYSLSPLGFLSLMREEMAALFGRFGAFLRDNGFSTPRSVCDAENARSNLKQITALCSNPKISAGITNYAALHAELIEKARHLSTLEMQWAEAISKEKELQEQRRIEQAKSSALALWETVFTMSFGQDIDWEKAWDKVARYWHDSKGWEPDDWGEQYEEWLVLGGARGGDDSFKAFLSRTGLLEQFDRQVKRIWKVRLLKAVLKQLGKSQCEPWIEQLIDEQVAKRDIEDEYDYFEYIQEQCRDHICRECFQYSEWETCCTCDKCEQCCKCHTGHLAK